MKNKHRASAKPAHELRFAVLAADNVIFTIRDQELLVRLVPVHIPPYFNHLAGLPGGLVAPTETADQAARRIIQVKADLSSDQVYLEQLYTFSAINRDPRGRVVAVAYLGLMPWSERLSGSDTKTSWWAPVTKLPKLAYDHHQIVSVGLERLRSRVTYTTLIAKIMPREFTLTELEQTMESIVGTDIDKRNFRKKINKLNLVQPLTKTTTGEQHRPARLYQFRSQAVVPLELL